ncbi:MAG: ATP-binding protein [Fidelibacterota bacterium]
MASRFPLLEATLSELTDRTGMSVETLLPVLDKMADKGLIMDLPYRKETYYLLLPGVIGFFEFTFMKNRTDLPLEKVARLMAEYFHWGDEHSQGAEFFGSKTQLTRSLVYDSAVPVTSSVVSLNSAKAIVREAEFGAAAMCYCRHQRVHEGKSCRKGAPVKGLCLTVGKGAEFLIRRGFAERKTTEELLDILDYAESLHLTHITDNVRHKPSFICNCCGCCCHIMEGVQSGYYQGVKTSPYQAVIDEDICDYCGACFTACNVRAITLDRNSSHRVSRVRDDICLGCGACITSCEKQAIRMEPRKKYTKPLKTKQGMFTRIAWEKGRLAPLLNAAVKKKLNAWGKNK